MKMGAFMIFDMKFKTRKDRVKFEKKYSPQVLVGEKSNSLGFVAWEMLRDKILEPIYFMGFMGYEDPKVILKEASQRHMKIIKLKFIPINDKKSKWKELRCLKE